MEFIRGSYVSGFLGGVKSQRRAQPHILPAAACHEHNQH